MDEFDIAIVGTGVAGISAAGRAAELGAKVCLIEKDRIGGSCVHSGLYPFKKIMSQLERFQTANGTGGEAAPDFPGLIRTAGNSAEAISRSWRENLTDAGAEIVFGQGTLINSREVFVRSPDKETLVTAKKIILATGSHVTAPNTIPFDGDRIIPIDEVFKPRSIPESCLILGAGGDGCEIATLFNHLGSRVFLCDEQPRLLPDQDPDVIDALEGAMKKQKIKLLLNKSILSIYKDDEKIDITLDGGVKFSVNLIVFAKGRKANTEGLDAERLGLRLGEHREVLVDEGMESSLKGVYGAGSVTGRSPSESLSQEEGRVAAENAMGKDKKLNTDWVPQIVYTHPEIATVGCFARDAHHKGFRAVEGRCDSEKLDYSMLGEEKPGLFKIVAERSSKRVIGAQIVSSRASEVIPMILLAIKRGLTVQSLAMLACGRSTQMQGVGEAARDCMRVLRSYSKGVVS